MPMQWRASLAPHNPRFPPVRDVRIRGIRRLLQLPMSKRRIARAIDDEIRFHIESRIEELVRGGVAAHEAREQAEAEYGDTNESRRELIAVDQRRFGRAQRREHLMSLIDDIRYAARSLSRRPSLLAVTIGALTIGIAANAVMFGIVDQLLLQPPAHVTAPDDVKRVYFSDKDKGSAFVSVQPFTTYQVVTRLREQASAFSHVSAFYRTTATLGRGEGARSIDIQLVSGNFFQLLGVQPAAGRALHPDDDRVPIGEQVAVISHTFWTRELAESQDAIGRAVIIAGKPFIVVGVAPAGFTGIDRRNVDFWVPVSSMAEDLFGAGWHNVDDAWWVQIIARIRDDAMTAQAEAQASTAYQALIREWRSSVRDSTSSIVLGTLIGTRTPWGISVESKVSLWLMGVSAIVLLIACANVANLLLARTLQRRREIAVRLALGVSRWRLVRMLLSETALLAGTSAISALLLSYWAARVVQQTLLPGVMWNGNIMDGRVLAFTIAATVLTVLLAGLAPALQGLHTPLIHGLKQASRQVSEGRSHVRTSLVVVQAALSIVLLVGAGLFITSLRKVNERDVGIDLDRVVRVTMNLANAGFDRPQIEDIYRQAQERLVTVPGVDEVSVVVGTMPTAGALGIGLRIPGIDSLPRLPGAGPYGAFVQANFFPTVGARIVRGRNFTADEERFPSRTMIINEMLATSYFGERDPVGTCIWQENDTLCTEIVGVAENVMLFSVSGDQRAMIYLPSSMAPRAPLGMVVRVHGDTKQVAMRIRSELQSLSPNMPYVRVASYAELVAPQLRPWRLGATMFSLMGAIALMIAVVGLYGVMAFLVSQRTHEIGVRMALGAQRADVVRLVAWQSARAVLLGLVLGSVLAAIASRWIAELLYETSARDPQVYLGAALALALAATVASIAPARRATAIHPAQALRAE